MDKGMHMTVIAPEGILFEGIVESAKFPGIKGEFTVWHNHSSLISGLSSGKIIYTSEGHTQAIPLQSGFVEISKNSILACIETQEPQ